MSLTPFEFYKDYSAKSEKPQMCTLELAFGVLTYFYIVGDLPLSASDPQKGKLDLFPLFLLT